jgi:predicted metal-dependent peptidase
MDLEQRLNDVAARMVLAEPFLASIFVKLPRKVVDWGTAATNGEVFYFCDSFCSDLNDSELMFIALHETAHVALQHSWRRGDREPSIYNTACDAVINPEIKRLPRNYQMPEGGVLFPWVTQEMSAEDVYSILRKQASEQPDYPQSGSGQGNEGEQSGQGGASRRKSPAQQGDDADGGKSPEEQAANTGGGGWDGQGDLMDSTSPEAQADIEATIIANARMFKAAGSSSAFADRVIDGANTPQVSWPELLRQVMTSTSKDDYSWRRGNRRYTHQGLYLPSLYTDSMGGLVVAVDTSGSVGQDEMNQFAAEINAIFEDCRPDWVEVIYCDTNVKHHERFNEGDIVELHAKGGGGTRFRPVFDYVEEMQERVSAMVFFTDLMGNVHELEEPDYPVLWGLTYGSKEAPFGETVRIDV